MRELELDHCGQRDKEHRNVLERLGAVVRVDEVDGSEPQPPSPRHHLHDLLHAFVDGIQLDLPRAVEKKICVRAERSESVVEPPHVLGEILHAVNEAAVWPQLELAHDALEANELTDVDCALVTDSVVCGIEVDHRDRAPDRLHELLHAIAVGALARPRRANNQLAERHGLREKNPLAAL
eukprot:Amastigsp_a858965_13.p2 type:complete len:180 gc:universal Amastigsp_a858965_13:597-1136(+)